MKRPKQPRKTPQEIAMERRTERRLDEEIGQTESRLKAQARGTVGAKSLLKGFQGRDAEPIRTRYIPKRARQNPTDESGLNPFESRILQGLRGMKKR